MKFHLLALLVGSCSFAGCQSAAGTHSEKATAATQQAKVLTAIAAVGKSEEVATELFGKPLNTIRMTGSSKNPDDRYQENKYKASNGLLFVVSYLNGQFRYLMVSKGFKKSEWKTVCARAGLKVSANTKLGRDGLVTPTPELPNGYRAHCFASDKGEGWMLSVVGPNQ